MKRITLPKILNSLLKEEHVVDVEPGIASRARRAVQRMIDISKAGG
jgi:quinolinate synthase